MSRVQRVRSTKKLTIKDLKQPDCWDATGGEKALKCLACLDGNSRDVRAAQLHELIPTHQRNAKHLLQQRREAAAADTASVSSGPSQPDPRAASWGRDLLDLFRTVSQAKGSGEKGGPVPEPASDPSRPSSPPDWVNFQFRDDDEQEPDEVPMDVDQTRQRLQDTLLDFLSGVHLDSDSDGESVGPCPSESSSSSDDEESGGMGTAAPRVRNRTFDSNAPFFPWRNKQEVSLSILMHLARSVLSEHQLELFIWAFGFNGVNDVPSVSSVKALDVLLQTLCGIETREYIGKMGHRYHVNSLADLIAQEHANPRISEHLSHLPVETNGPVSSPRESRKWLHEVDPSLATPMIRQGGQDFYVFEPTLLAPTSPVGRACIPVRWFIRDGVRFARAWRLSVADRFDQRVGQPIRGWCVHEWETVDVPEHDLLLSLPRFAQSHEAHHLPSPHIIHGSFLTPGDRTAANLTPWERTKPADGNPWRQRADGSEVRAFPIWLYCDDTSGNQSKKWNKHNSFLFTPAGLPREHAHQEYNVHFLTTSNIAPVPEMLDGIVNEIEICQQHGVWAFDHATKSVVLLIPFVLGLLGDNPMQSELSCHIGMKGKFFCRTCWVDRGKAEDDDASDCEGETPEAPQPTSGKRKKKPAETAREMLQRIKRFVTVGRRRTREETLATVNELDAKMRSGGNLDAIRTLKTSTGVKDTSLQFFIDKLEAAMKGKRARAAREAAFERAKADLPSQDLRSAIFKLRSLDPHCDTPVEVLHVILIGVIKYFWRDVVKNQCSSDQKQRELIARLDSFDTSGLGISPLRGHTLVTYAGSLVGRDFRAIAQAAPFVLHGGLVSADCYRAWVELAALVPLVWQPVIESMDEYIVSLLFVSCLLAATAEWSPRWFNKPKFHLLLHLPDHIRRFGPAILFATEAFESFNAVIRAKSIHSNRQAPSRDIALGFAHGNRMRHLLSGGWIRPYEAPGSSVADPKRSPSPEEKRNHRQIFRLKKPDVSDFVCAGTRVVQLVDLYSPVRSYLGIHDPTTRPSVTLSGPKTVCYEKTVSCSQAPLVDIDPLDEVSTFRRINLQTGDSITPGNWVLVAPSHVNLPHVDSPAIGKVAEIQPVVNSPVYQMPVIPPLRLWRSVPAQPSTPSANDGSRLGAYTSYSAAPGMSGAGFGPAPGAAAGQNALYSQGGHQATNTEQISWETLSLVPTSAQDDMGSSSPLQHTGLSQNVFTPSDGAMDFDSDPEASPEAMLAAMVDNICNRFQLNEEYIASLHLFVEITEGLTIPDRISRVYMLAATFKVSIGVDSFASQFALILGDLKNIKEEFEAHFILSEDQKTVVRVFAQEEIFKPKRMDFMTMHIDVLQRIMQNRKDLGYDLVFKSPARENILGTYNKTYCSGLRNQVRISVRDGATVGHKSAVHIIKFTMELAEKYQRGGAAAVYSLDNEHTLKCALLRYIALQNKELLGIGESSKQGSRGDASEPADATVNNDSAKRKRQNGRPKDDDHFWSIASKFLEDKEEELGKPFKTAAWSQFMNKVLNEDMALFGRPPAKDLARAASNAQPSSSMPTTPAPTVQGVQSRPPVAASALLNAFKKTSSRTVSFRVWAAMDGSQAAWKAP
ncbi:hypothetical protein AURDEDRAFT_159655 [Auricularia subglabra TFB-10046 SS5]|nr:hypothetical protein AURDEDRAFT_159655 [Auricularia subglabra TFB-10046 SS5]